VADINIQRKSSSAIWWILGVVALVVLIWLLFAWDTEPVTTRLPGGSGPIAASVADVHVTAVA
jgi:hypothetical protein